jgi:hypothetical protein
MVTLICEQCNAPADGLIGGFMEQSGAAWCVGCCDKAKLKVPTVLRHPDTSDRALMVRKEVFEEKQERRQTREHNQIPFDSLKIGDILTIRAEPEEDLKKFWSRFNNQIYKFRCIHQTWTLKSKFLREENVIKVRRDR